MFMTKGWRNLFFIILIFPMFMLVCYRIHIEKENTDELALISFSVGESDIQNINVWRDDGDTYYIFLPAETEKIKINLSKQQRLLLDIREYKDGDCIEVEYGIAYDTQVLDRSDNSLETGKCIFLKSSNIPTMYIDAVCADTDLIVNEKSTKAKVGISVYNQEGMLDYKGNCTIKGRGNSTWEQKKKPYNIDLENATSILSMKSQKKWALIAEGQDSSLLKNKIAITLAEKSGLEYTPEMEYINLYVNGTYQGVYLLAQRVAAIDGCISWDENEDNVLFERDARYKDEDMWFETDTCGIVYESTSILSEEKKQSFSEQFKKIEKVIFDKKEDKDTVLDECSGLIDVESWIKQYMIAEFLANVDMEYSSRFFYMKDNSPIIYGGPIWDYDNSIGGFSTVKGEIPANTLRYEGLRSSYFKGLMQYDDFRQEYLEYYSEYFVDYVEMVIDDELPNIVSALKQSMYLNDIRWDDGKVFEEEADKVFRWLSDRTIFWEDFWGNSDEYCKFFCQDGGGVYYYKKGDKISFLPQILGHEFTTWVNENGDEITEGMIAGKDMILYPEYPEE